MTPDEYIARYMALMDERLKVIRDTFRTSPAWAEIMYGRNSEFQRIDEEYKQRIRELDDHYAAHANYSKKKNP